MLERLVARSFRALDQRDLAGVLRYYADDAVFEFPGRTPISGTIVGKPAIEVWWRRVLDRMVVFHFTPRHVALANPIGLTWSNTLFVEIAVEARTVDGLTAHVELVSVLTYRHGKVVHARDYFFDMRDEERIWGIVAKADQSAEPVDRPVLVGSAS